MHVIGQDHPGNDIERMPLLDDADRTSKVVDTIHEQGAGTIGQIDREEAGAAFPTGTPIVPFTCCRFWASLRSSRPLVMTLARL